MNWWTQLHFNHSIFHFSFSVLPFRQSFFFYAIELLSWHFSLLLSFLSLNPLHRHPRQFILMKMQSRQRNERMVGRASKIKKTPQMKMIPDNNNHGIALNTVANATEKNNTARSQIIECHPRGLCHRYHYYHRHLPSNWLVESSRSRWVNDLDPIKNEIEGLKSSCEEMSGSYFRGRWSHCQCTLTSTHCCRI